MEKRTNTITNNSVVGRSDIVPRSDLTNKTFIGKEWSNLSAIQSLFNGDLFREMEICDSDLSRCDFEGTVIERSSFDKVNLTDTDIRSCKFSDTKFSKCDFSGSFIKNCLFINCRIENCSFNETAFTECDLIKSQFKGSSLKASTNILNQFSDCSFKDMKFGDCTFLLHVFDGCRFDNTAFNADSIGLLFGLTEEVITQSQLIFLGKQQPEITKDTSISDTIIEEYNDRDWILHSAISKLNFEKYQPINFLKEITDFWVKKLNSGAVLLMDEASFVDNVLKKLQVTNRLPYWGLQYFFQTFGQAMKAIEDKQNLNFATGNKLLNLSYLHFLNLQKESKYFFSYPKGISLDSEIICKIKMHKPPKIDICDLMDSVAYAITKKGFKSKILKTERGSILYWIGTTVGAVFGIKLILFGLNGCIIQLTELFSRIQVLSTGQTNTYKAMALTSEQRIPEDIALALNSVYSMLLQQKILNSHDLCGLGAENIISVETSDINSDSSDPTQSSK